MVFPFYRLGCLGRRIRGRETPWGFPGPRCHQYKLHLFLPETGLERVTLRVKIGGPALSHELDHGERFRNTIIWSRIIPQPRVTSKHQKHVYATTTQTMQQQTESLRQPRYTKDKFCLLLSFVYFCLLLCFGIAWRWDLARLVSFISSGTSRQGVKTASSGLPGSIKCFDYLF